MSWWDYGYWIMRIAHRIPNSNPGQGHAVEAALFFAAQDENSASQVMDKMGSKYVMIDYQMPTSKFYAMPAWAGSNQDEFFETYYRKTQGGKLEPVPFFYPAYYRSMVVRLYNFDGKVVTPQDSTIVISYEEKLSQEKVQYKEITNSRSFPTFEAAEAYISSQESGNYRIVGTSPLTTPVPLEELKNYKLVHKSDAMATITGKNLPSVKIFEYVKSSE
jgi:dolichyl-diphosphooligosaccharide--protein glycosyltransferase